MKANKQSHYFTFISAEETINYQKFGFFMKELTHNFEKSWKARLNFDSLRELIRCLSQRLIDVTINRSQDSRTTPICHLVEFK